MKKIENYFFLNILAFGANILTSNTSISREMHPARREMLSTQAESESKMRELCPARVAILALPSNKDYTNIVISFYIIPTYIYMEVLTFNYIKLMYNYINNNKICYKVITYTS